MLGELQIRNTSRLGGIHFTHIFPLCLAVIVSVAHVDARGCCVNTVRERTARVCVFVYMCAWVYFLTKKKKSQLIIPASITYQNPTAVVGTEQSKPSQHSAPLAGLFGVV